MQRFTGDFQGNCEHCGEAVEFAIGIQTDRDPVAMHFGPGGPVPIELQNVQLIMMIGDELDLKYGFNCPLCGGRTSGRSSCRKTPDSL